MTSLESFIAWLDDAPDGTTIPVASLRSTLAALRNATPEPSIATADVSPASWRERLWTVPPDTRLGVIETAEALGRPRSFVYRHTSEKSAGAARLPHRRLDGELVFVAGELRSWLKDHEETIESSRASTTTLSLSGVRRLHA